MNNLEIGFLFCNHPLYLNKVDMDYEQEYIECNKLFKSCLFSYEDLINEDKVTLIGTNIPSLLIYRGWMLKPQEYEVLYNKMLDEGIVLVNTPEEYNGCHMLPNWYEDFKQETPFSVWTQNYSEESILKLLNQFKHAAIVKDYVKSRKHEWYDACYIKDVSNVDDAKRVINNFISRQGDSLVGGVVLREYISLSKIGFHDQSGMPISEEYRAFYFNGQLVALDNYWIKDIINKISNDEIQYIKSIGKRLKSNFATVDFARNENGNLAIMEIGDGQVSGLQQIDEKMFYESIFKLIN